MSKVYDALLKSGKFSAAQIKKEDEGEIDSISELVAICEKEGFIPKYYVDGPQDKVDRVIEDLKEYTQELVKDEIHLDTMFETAQRQMQEEQERIAVAASLGEKNEEDTLFHYEAEELTEKDYLEMTDFLDEEKKKDEEEEV